jgi:hypothetical protein
MVRIRKNANTLTPGERDRFIAAFAQLNNQGLGRFADFRDMHTSVSSPQAHGCARIFTVASRLSARSRARATGNRSECVDALLAFRSGVARISSSANFWASQTTSGP